MRPGGAQEKVMDCLVSRTGPGGIVQSQGYECPSLLTLIEGIADWVTDLHY